MWFMTKSVLKRIGTWYKVVHFRTGPLSLVLSLPLLIPFFIGKMKLYSVFFLYLFLLSPLTTDLSVP